MSRVITLVFAGALLSGCQSTQASEPWVYRQTADDKASFEMWAAMEARWLGVDRPTDPVDALYWRAVACGFAVSEMNGDAEMDASIDAAMRNLGCGRQIEDARALRVANLDDARMVARIDEFIQFRK